MKKLSVLVALMLITTVGGVYANWIYVRAINSIDPVTASINVKLAQPGETDAPEGTITAEKSDDFSLLIDQKEVGGGEAIWVTMGGIEVTYTPHANAARNAIPMQFALSGTLPDGIEIDLTPIKLKNGDPITSVTITAADIAAAIDLTDLDLPKLEDYNAFATALGNGEITITISEYDPREGYNPEPGI